MGERELPTGRASVRGPLAAAVASVLAGRGELLLLTGEPGIGKTTAARELTGLASAQGAEVVWTACSPDDPVAHRPWLSLLSALGDEMRVALAALTGAEALDGSAASASRAGAYERVIMALTGRSEARPLVIVIDDLHWADEGTLQLLASLRGRLPALACLVVGTYRDAEIPDRSPLSDLALTANRIALSGLVSDEVAQLLGDVLGRQPDPGTVSEVRRRTGGNPFLVLQVARLLASGSEDALPAGARDVLGRRLDALPEHVREVLGAAATLGSPFGAATVAAIVGLDGVAVLDALDLAASARVVERMRSAGEWSFVHDLFRAAVLDALPTSTAATLHNSAGAVLAGAGVEPAIVAHHLLAGSTGSNSTAANWSIKAAERALGALAWEEAVGHAERAMAALPARASDPGTASRPTSDPTSDALPVRIRCLLVLGRARLLAGDGYGAADAFGNAAALAVELGSAELLADAALGFAADLGGFEVRLFDQRQIDLLEQALAALGDEHRPAVRSRVMARLSVALSFTASAERRLALAERSVALARSVGDPLVLAGALAAHCDAIAGPDDIDRRLVEATEIVELASSVSDGGLEMLGRRLRFVAVLESGDVAGAEAEAAAFARRAETVGNPLYAWYVPLWRGMWLLARGEVAGAEAAIEEVRLIGSRAGSVNAPMLADVLFAEVLFNAGRADDIPAMLDQLREHMADLIESPQAAGNMARAYSTIGKVLEAKGALDRFHAAGLAALPFDAEWLPAMAVCIEAAVELDHPFLPALVAAAEPYAHRSAFEGIGAGLHGSLARQLAMGHSALGHHDGAVARARQALDANAPAGTLLVARSQITLADALADRGDSRDVGEAERLSAAGTSALTELGVTVRRGRRAASVVTAPLTPRPSAATGRPERRTDAEFRRDGDVWRVQYGDQQTIVKHSKGISDLVVLLTRPGQEVHVSELEALPASLARAARASTRDAALDRRAISEYRARLQELESDIDEAVEANDSGRAERSRIEREFLIEELSASVGLGRRARLTGPDPVERLRKAVTARVRDAVRRIEAVHPALGRHLSNSVRTGTFCSYVPEQPVNWRCEVRSGAP